MQFLMCVVCVNNSHCVTMLCLNRLCSTTACSAVVFKILYYTNVRVVEGRASGVDFEETSEALVDSPDLGPRRDQYYVH